MSLDFNNPIRIFYANMLRIGLVFKIRDGKLKVSDPNGVVTPVLKEEIRKRAEHLIDLLSPEIPEELEPYFYRLIRVDELKEAIRIAEVMGISLRTTPVNGGWLIEIVNRKITKAGKL